MKTAIYNTPEGRISINYDENSPCRICKLPVVFASVGGVDVCPWCDNGYDRPEKEKSMKLPVMPPSTLKINSPYVCVTGFDDPSQIDSLVIPTTSVKIVCGILCSHKSLSGSIQSHKPRFPTFNAMSEMIGTVCSRKLTSAIHYCPKASSVEEILQDVDKVLELDPDMIQINCDRMAGVQTISAAVRKNQKRPINIVFQLNGTLVKKHGSHSNVLKEFKSFQREGDYCLYDMSGGRGVPLGEDCISWDGDDIYHSSLPGLVQEFGFAAGAAGGVTEENVISMVAKFAGNTSVDVESNVRDKQDKLDMAKVNSFYANAISAMK